jgi:hypothetical protein
VTGLDAIALAERHGDELPDRAVAGVEAVQPGLERTDEVILWRAEPNTLVRLAGNRVDPADDHL